VAKPGHIYHWKHGWIPITPRAAMVKAKGHRGLAERYMHDYGVHDNRSEGHDRRQGGSVDVGDKRKGEHRGTFQYRPGTKTRDYPDRPGEGYFHPQAHGNKPGPTSAAEAFRMGRKDLEPHAKAGNPHAQAELDRRNAKRAGKPTAAPKAAPAPKPEAPKAPAAPRSHGGHPLPEITPATKAKHAESMYGTGSDEHITALEAHNREIEKGLPKGTHISSQRSMAGVTHFHEVDGRTVGSSRQVNGKFTAESRGEYFGSYDTREEAHSVLASHAAPHQPLPKAAPETPAKVPGEIDLEAVGAEDVRINTALPEGHHVNGSLSNRFDRQTGRAVPSVYSSHYVGPRSIGHVTEVGDGTFRATHRHIPVGNKNYKYEDLEGRYASRAEAHKALAAAHEAAEAKKAAAAARKAERTAKTAGQRSEAGAKVLALKPRGINGNPWEVHEVEPNTRVGRKALGTVRYSFKNGNKTVVVEAPMSEAEVKGLLDDTADVLERAGKNVEHIPVTVRVPSGDSTFRWSDAGGNTGGYVWSGDTTIHVNPVIARGEARGESFGHNHEGTHFMPVNGKADARAYVITHELGHVVDGHNGHTRGGNIFAPYSPEAAAVHNEHVRGGGFQGKYGRKNPSEGYAEAFAQHQMGGVGSHTVSDAYAEKYGWHPPTSKYVDGERRGLTPAASKPLTSAQEAQRAAFQDDLEKRLGLGKYATARSSNGYQLKDAQKARTR
jgi:hypothetical protein